METEIRELKVRRNAVILAHYYEDGEIQDLADYVGDSLYLAQQVQKIDAPVVLLAGVIFMAESVKLLSPEKTVLVPDMEAGCSLVQQSPFEQYRQWRQDHPEHIAVTYVNSSAAVKSISDVICTSSNAEKIIHSIPIDRPILFGPDQHLGRYLVKKLNRPMQLWPGACQVHVLFSAQKLFRLLADYPEAVVLAHPECDEHVLQYAHVVGSTSRLLEEVKINPAQTFIVATEDGIFHQMRKARPEAQLIQAPVEGSCACNRCPYMKLNNLEKIKQTLETLSPQIHLDPAMASRARVPLERMLTLTSNRSIEWPKRFVQ